MKLKHTVKFKDTTMAICTALVVVDSIYRNFGYDCVITSVNDSSHGVNSLHFADRAFDVRTKNIPRSDFKKQIIDAIKASLTADFDVIFEDNGGNNEHLHIEFDPK